jgi:sporulation related protein
MSPRLEMDDDERADGEDEPQRSTMRPLRAALLALAVAALVGGSWWAGHSSKPSPQDGAAVPEIHPDTAPVKEQPKDPGGMVVPGQDSVLLNRNAKEKPEELLPPPETVKQRPPPPAPPPQAATASPPPPPGATPTPGVNAQPLTPTPTPAPQVATAPPAPVAPPTPVAPKAVAPAPAAPKVAPPPPAAAGSYRLQLGALKTEEAAKAEWLKLQRQNSDVLGKLSLSVSRIQLGAKGTYYRIQAGPVADEGRASQACAALKSRNVSCILVKP